MGGKSKPKQKTPGRQAVAEFNATHPVGSEVRFRKANGEIVPATIRSVAELNRGLGPVVWLIGIAGPKALTRIMDPEKEQA